MTSKTPDEGPKGLRRAVKRLQEQLRELSVDLGVLQEELRADQTNALIGSGALAREIQQWMKISLEVERDIEKRACTSGERTAEPNLDLDRARASIRCQLDRLRRARCPGGVPKRFE